MSYYDNYKKDIDKKGYIGTNCNIDYSKITKEQRNILKHLIDIGYLEDVKNMVEVILLDLHNDVKEVK